MNAAHTHIASAEGGSMLFELRQYTTRPGQRENWVRCMEEEIRVVPQK